MKREFVFESLRRLYDDVEDEIGFLTKDDKYAIELRIDQLRTFIKNIFDKRQDLGQDVKLSSEYKLDMFDQIYDYSNKSLYQTEKEMSSDINPDDMFLKPKNIVEEYNDMQIKPYLKKIDLNQNDETTKSKDAWEIGVNFSF